MECMSLTLETRLAATTSREFLRLSDVLVWVYSRFREHDTKYQPFAYKKLEMLREVFREGIRKRNLDLIPLLDEDRIGHLMSSWIPWSVWDQNQEEYVNTIPDVV